jgi:hypothetical protein
MEVGDRSPKSEVRRLKSEVRRPESEVARSESKSEVRAESFRQETEVAQSGANCLMPMPKPEPEPEALEGEALERRDRSPCRKLSAGVRSCAKRGELPDA